MQPSRFTTCPHIVHSKLQALWWGRIVESAAQRDVVLHGTAQDGTGCESLPGSWTLSRRDLRSASAGGRILMLQALFSPALQSCHVKHKFFGMTATHFIKLSKMT